MKRRNFLKTSAVAAALVALTSCSSSNGVHETGSVHDQSGGVTVNTSGGPAESLTSGARLMLRDGWQVQTSSGQPEGETISKPGFATSGWFATSVPATVSGVLAQSGKFPDPFFGMNLRGWPGRGASSSSNTLPANPFSVAWWFRTEFNLPAEMTGRAIALDLEGVNYRAEVWLNGERIADTNQVVGAMRRFAFDITKAAQPEKKNALALRIQGQGPKDLGHTWVDWAPMPPDKMQGLWRDVFVTASGVLRMHDSFVHSRLSTNLNSADVIISMDLENTSDKPVTGVVAVTLDGVVTKIPVTVAGSTTQKVSLDGKDQPGLHLTKPRLWWPVGFGAPEMYSLHVGVSANNKVSDERTIRFGVREVTSELTSDTNRLYYINHHPILIRGAGWARNLFFMETPKREEQEMRLVRDMGMNAVRFEGKIGSDHLLDLADENGIFVLPGFCCCDYWEQWSQWNDATKALAVACLRDQLLLLRNHPSILMFWYGSDKFAPPEVEREYLKVVAQTEWPNPTVASASGVTTTVGPSGVKMQGPYDYEPPSYWYSDHDGGAFGFATEIGTGKTLPSIEDMRRMLGDDHLWPRDNAWTLHSQGGAYTAFTPFEDGMRSRYGAATNLDDYVRKAQLIAYDNERAMFEAYGRNKYKATGVIKWMLNNAWPSLAWHLYDYYLEPGSGYYGTKKSLEPLHVQYSFDDHSVVVVNSTLNQSSGLKVRAAVIDISGARRWTNSAGIDVPPDGVVRAFTIPDLANLSKTYFLSLTLEDKHGAVVSRNFYWLSTVEDVLDWTKRQWYYAPTKVHGDFTDLSTLPAVKLGVKTAFDHDGADDRALVTLANPGPSLAFFVRLRILQSPDGTEILPSMWSDNYVSLLPGETRTLTARWRSDDAPGAKSRCVKIDGYNTPATNTPIK
jgi:exo-1,4-beta-D-glucosaminidase